MSHLETFLGKTPRPLAVFPEGERPLNSYNCSALQAEVGWRRPARIRNVRWLDSGSKDATEMAAVKSLSTSKSLWDIVRGREFEATIDKPTILGATDKDGDACIQKVLEVTVLMPKHTACNTNI